MGFKEGEDELVVIPVADSPGSVATLPRPDKVADEFAAIIITGSSHMVTDRLPWSEALREWLRAVAELHQVPILGVCYGHQLLADALGGHVRYNPGGRGLGTIGVTVIEENAKEDPLFTLFVDRQAIWCHASHVQHVARLPPSAVRLAASGHDDNHAFRFGPWTWGVQFHPEFTTAVVSNIIKTRGKALSLEGGASAEERLANVRKTTHGRELLQRFMELAKTKWTNKSRL